MIDTAISEGFLVWVGRNRFNVQMVSQRLVPFTSSSQHFFVIHPIYIAQGRSSYSKDYAHLPIQFFSVILDQYLSR